MSGYSNLELLVEAYRRSRGELIHSRGTRGLVCGCVEAYRRSRGELIRVFVQEVVVSGAWKPTEDHEVN